MSIRAPTIRKLTAIIGATDTTAHTNQVRAVAKISITGVQRAFPLPLVLFVEPKKDLEQAMILAAIFDPKKT